jgi:RNA polymerase sigma-70 factor (ECF subfamily)
VGDADPDLLVALQALSVQDAEVLRLWASEQLWASQIVTVLGITTNAASIRLHRAANTLRNELLTRKQPRAAGHLVSRV